MSAPHPDIINLTIDAAQALLDSAERDPRFRGDLPLAAAKVKLLLDWHGSYGEEIAKRVAWLRERWCTLYFAQPHSPAAPPAGAGGSSAQPASAPPRPSRGSGPRTVQPSLPPSFKARPITSEDAASLVAAVDDDRAFQFFCLLGKAPGSPGVRSVLTACALGRIRCEPEQIISAYTAGGIARPWAQPEPVDAPKRHLAAFIEDVLLLTAADRGLTPMRLARLTEVFVWHCGPLFCMDVDTHPRKQVAAIVERIAAGGLLVKGAPAAHNPRLRSGPSTYHLTEAGAAAVTQGIRPLFRALASSR